MHILLCCLKTISALQYYRMLVPHQALARDYPEIKIFLLYGQHDENAGDQFPDVMTMNEEDLAPIDIVVFQRNISYNDDYNQNVIRWLHAKGKKVVFDIDDFWRVPRNHNFFDSYSKNNWPLVTERTMAAVDLVTCTGEEMANRAFAHNQNVEVLPNAIDPDLDKQWNRRHIKSPRIRIGWAGGMHHRPDLEIMRESFKKLHLYRPDQWQLCLGGFNMYGMEYVEIEKIMTDGHRLVMDDKPYMEYLSLGTPAMEHTSIDKPYRRLWGKDIYSYADIYNNFDIVLAPLEDNSFNRCKSELKIIEAAMMGKAVIASAIPPYIDCIDHGHDGFLVNSNRNNIDWYIYMKRYINNPALIKIHADRLSKKICEKFNIKKINKKRKQLYEEIKNS